MCDKIEHIADFVYIKKDRIWDIMDNELKVTYLYSIITNNEEIFNKEIKEHTIIV